MVASNYPGPGSMLCDTKRLVRRSLFVFSRCCCLWAVHRLTIIVPNTIGERSIFDPTTQHTLCLLGGFDGNKGQQKRVRWRRVRPSIARPNLTSPKNPIENISKDPPCDYELEYAIRTDSSNFFPCLNQSMYCLLNNPSVRTDV